MESVEQVFFNVPLSKLEPIFKRWIKEAQTEIQPTKVEPTDQLGQPKQEKIYVYGLMGIAGLLGCSITTASKIKHSGKLDKAIYQEGNTIVIDAEKALKLAKLSGYVYRP